jgi:hypothetical protein
LNTRSKETEMFKRTVPERFAALVVFLFALSAFFTLAPGAAFALTSFDKLTTGNIDSTKWGLYETVRVLDRTNTTTPAEWKMHLGVRSGTGSTGTVMSALKFINPSTITKLGATVTPKSNYSNPYTTDAPYAMAAIGGIFFNSSDSSTDCTNDVLGQVGIGNVSTTNPKQVLYWSVSRFTNSDCTESETLDAGVFANGAEVTVGAAYPVSAEWDGSKFTFIYNNSETAYSTPSTYTTPITTLYNPNTSFRGLYARIRNNAGKEAFISGYFDDVYTNSTGSYALYDNFPDDQIDASKWSNYEYARGIREKHLVLLGRGATDSATYTENLLPIASPDPDTVWTVQATVTGATLVSGDDTTAHAMVGVGGMFFNDGSVGEGNIGDIAAMVRLQTTPDKGLVCRWKVTRYTGSSDFDQAQLAEDSKGDLALISADKAYTLSVSWDGNKFTFTGAGKKATYTPDAATFMTNATRAKNPFKGLFSVITRGGVNASAQGYFTNVSIGTGGVPVFLNVAVTGAGTVTGSGTAIACTSVGDKCSQAFVKDKKVTLVAKAATGYVFNAWSGCDTMSKTTCAVTMSAAKSVTATFTTNPTLAVSPTSKSFGSVSVSSGKSSTATFTVTNKTTKGTADLVIGAVNLTGNTTDYAIAQDGCSGATVLANKTCKFNVIFKPLTVDAAVKTAVIHFPSNDPATTPVTVNLTGYGKK